FPLSYHIFYHFGELNQRFPKAVSKPNIHFLIQIVLSRGRPPALFKIMINIPRAGRPLQGKRHKPLFFVPNRMAAAGWIWYDNIE
ncbi:hypothetical protein, partial [uncultured Oscillibacter sp.]|uniref:hypothetical protein n=1 Tax=uncultured Oscillibacter sp. TaxID=876091 RepID=UPI00266F6919